MKEVVVFFLSGKEYGVEIAGMQGLENYVPLTELSDPSEKMLGVVTIRNEIVPVINIKKYLILPHTGVTAQTKYVILRTTKGKVAFIVDGVSEILKVDGDGVMERPSLLQGNATAYVDFIARSGQKLVVVINPEGLLTDDDWKNIHNMIEKMEENND
jgi:purine-binding chemotaxis protein CheW